MSYREADIAFLCFDGSNKKRYSFDGIESWVEKTKRYAREDTSICLVATKCDDRKEACITREEAEEKAKEIDALCYFETAAALEGKGVESAFREAIKARLSLSMEKEKEKRWCEIM